MIERSFQAMGTAIRVMVGDKTDEGSPDPALAALSAEMQVRDFDRRLSRFIDESELSRFNRDTRSEVEASVLLRAVVRAGLWAARQTNGLVDPTLLPELEAAGYVSSRRGMKSAPLHAALAAAPERKPARADDSARWRDFEVDDEAGTIRRRPGLMFDSGGVGKGFAADLVSGKLAGYTRFAVDMGGDVRVGGREPAGEPVEIEVRNPLTGSASDAFPIGRGAVATSGLDVRLWGSREDGFRHHLIDPSTGEPAWTGVICATARAPTALEADVLAKAAILGGEASAREVLARHGGLIVREDGSVEQVGNVRSDPAA